MKTRLGEKFKEVNRFVGNCLDDYCNVISYAILVNYEAGDSIDFEVYITNTTNDNKQRIILRNCDTNGIQILLGDDFYDTNDVDFPMQLFMGEFLTFPEN